MAIWIASSPRPGRREGDESALVADMFGLALRSYQKNVHRLIGSATERETSLWEALLQIIHREGSVSRGDLRYHAKAAQAGGSGSS